MLIDEYIDSSSLYPFYKDTDCFLVVCKPHTISKTVIVHENPKKHLSYLHELLIFPDPSFVTLYSVSWEKKIRNLYSYSYEMERLFPLTEDEKKFFATFAPKYPGPWTSPSLKEFTNSLLEQSDFLDLDNQAFLTFYQNIIQSKYLHPDFAAHNIMKNSCGQFQFIDYENLIKNETND